MLRLPDPVMHVTIRQAARSDLDSLVRLLDALFRIERDFVPDAIRQRRGLELMLAAPDQRCVMVAARGEVLVGMATAQVVISTAEGAPSALVEDVVVAAGHRGEGIGRELLDALAGWASARGAARLQLLADRDNAPASRFYARLGWERTQLVCWRRKPHGHPR